MPKLVVVDSLKKFQVLEKKNFKNISRLFVQIRFSKKIIWSQDIPLLVILWFRKIVLLSKIAGKMRTTKNQENSAHRFGENYLTDHLMKFFKRNSLEKVL